MNPQPQPGSGPLSRRFDVSSIKDRVVTVVIETSVDERRALAEDCGIPGIDALAAELRVSREASDIVRVAGRVTGLVRLTCVVSLEDFESDLDESVDIRFAPLSEVDAMAAARAARPILEDDEEDLPDPIVGGRIDLGALVTEALSLGLDPYPRKPGSVFAEPEGSRPETPEVSPFTALRALKGRDQA